MSRVAFVRIACAIILASVALTTVTASALVSAQYARYSFVLEASGKAYDRAGNPQTVKIRLTGTAYGNPAWLMKLDVARGTVKVAGKEFRITGGHGMLIQANNYIHLNIRITRSGRDAIWNMRGTTGVLYGNEIPLTLSSRHVVLPTSPHFTMLYKLGLTGKMVLT